MIRVVASNSPIDIAWAAFDAAAIRFHRMYAKADTLLDTDAERARRMEAAQEVSRLWDEWRALFVAPEDGPSAA